MGGGQRKRDPDVGALRSPDPGRTTPVSVQPRTPDRGCAERRGRGSLTIRGSWRQRRPARSLPVGSAPPPVPRWWPLRPRGPARGAQAQRRPTGASPRCFSELVVSVHGHTRAHTHTDLYPQSLSLALSLTDTRTCSILTLTHTHTPSLTHPLHRRKPEPEPPSPLIIATHCFLGLIVRSPDVPGPEGSPGEPDGSPGEPDGIPTLEAQFRAGVDRFYIWQRWLTPPSQLPEL